MKAVCLQIGHWGIENITQDGLRSWRSSAILKRSTGGSGERVYHWEEVMPRLRDKLIAAGIQVFISGATYDEEIYSRDYDLWVSLHYDGGGTGDRCMASAPGRDTLPAYLNQSAQSEAERFVQVWKDVYPDIVGVDYKEKFVTNGMTDYYAFDYVGYNTPSVILEHFNHSSERGKELKKDAELVAEANFKAIVKFLGIPDKPPVQKDTYTIVYKGEVLQEYEYNPSDKIAELSASLEENSKKRADLLSEFGTLKADLEDAHAIASEFRRELSDARTERDNAKAALGTAEKNIGKKNQKIVDLEKKVEALEKNDPLSAYSAGDLLAAGFSKLFKRR